MGVGYTNDMFYNSQEPGTQFTSPTGTPYTGLLNPNNQKFVYPSREVRLGVNNDTVQLERGYIRSLMTYSNGVNLPIKKCAFQFNPDVLQHSVSANTSMLNVLQQDPAQYAQSMPSSINFNFQLRFDRSYELNNPTNKVTTSGNIWESNDPSQVGVLHDLAALYNVIGQGIGSTQIDYLSKVMYNNLVTENNAKVASSSSTSTDTSTSGALSTDNLNTYQSKTIPDFLQHNIGNVTFLLPVPVRVVFSSLYIVEGLIQSTDVVFTKFTTQMVPMQCVVQVTMEGKYVGFAKKDTFFSWALQEQEKQQRADVAAANAAAADLTKAFRNSVSSIYFEMRRAGYNSSGDASLGGSLYPVATFSDMTDTSFYYGFYTNPVPAKSLSKDKDAVSQLYKSSTTLSTSQYHTMVIWGPFTNLSYASSYSSDALAQELQKLNSKGSASKYLVTGMNGSCLDATVTDQDHWEIIKGFGAWSVLTRPSGDFTTDTVALSYNSGCIGHPKYVFDSSKYYILAIDASMTATDGSSTIKGSGKKYVLYGPSNGANSLNFTVPITWPDAPKDPGSVPTVTQTYTPGKTSNVGATTSASSTAKVPARF